MKNTTALFIITALALLFGSQVARADRRLGGFGLAEWEGSATAAICGTLVLVQFCVNK